MNKKLMTPDLYFRDLPKRNQEVLEERLISSANGITDKVADTGLELLRQLTIINGAGIAGATAIAATSGIESTSLFYFCWGIGLAIVALVMAYMFGFYQMIRLNVNAIGVLVNDKPLSSVALTKTFVTTTAITWITAGGSIAMFFIGAHKLTKIFL